MPAPKKKVAKKKMQNVAFGSVDEFLAYLPEHELKIVTRLRKLIFDCIPGCDEHLAYNVPFYRVHSNICFIWPGSITWSTTQREGVRLGFANGYLLQGETGYLDKGKRRYVYWKDFFHTTEIDTGLLRPLIYDAAFIDEEKAKKKMKRKPAMGK